MGNSPENYQNESVSGDEFKVSIAARLTTFAPIGAVSRIVYALIVLKVCNVAKPQAPKLGCTRALSEKETAPMKDIVEWLMRIEQISERLYREASLFFSDAGFRRFLAHSAEDESLHYRIIARAAQTIRAKSKIGSAFSIDQEIRKTIERHIQVNQARLEGKLLTEAQMIDCVVNTEFSEWNDIFLYVVNSLKEIEPQFKTAAAKIQNHLRQVEYFLSTSDYGRQKTEIIRNLKPVWKEKILIVEDEPAILELLVAILGSEGSIDTAENGEIGLEKIRKQYYRLVVSDIDMPVMDGMDLFRQAALNFKGIGRRFLFLTGNLTGPVAAFFKTNNLKHLTKPASINAIRSHALAAMHDLPVN